jgi:hypothetical protein
MPDVVTATGFFSHMPLTAAESSRRVHLTDAAQPVLCFLLLRDPQHQASLLPLMAVIAVVAQWRNAAGRE